MKKLLATLVALLFLTFAVLAGRGHLRPAVLALTAGFLVGAAATGCPTDAERQAARQRAQQQNNPSPY